MMAVRKRPLKSSSDNDALGADLKTLRTVKCILQINKKEPAALAAGSFLLSKILVLLDYLRGGPVSMTVLLRKKD